jgi:hypothetical protein
MALRALPINSIAETRSLGRATASLSAAFESVKSIVSGSERSGVSDRALFRGILE